MLFRVLKLFLQADTAPALVRKEQGNRNKDEKHLERRKINPLTAAQVVTNHVSRAQKQVTHRTKDASVTHSPYIKEVEQGRLGRKPANIGPLATSRTIISLEMRATRGADLLTFRNGSYLRQ